jgi:hypothetical protein
MNKKSSQNDLILDHLKSGNTLTPLEAMYKFNCLRLSGRILDLRKSGHHIITENYKTPSGKHVARYYLC